MAVNIVVAKKTYLKSSLSASAGTLVLRYLKDAKGNNLSMANFGNFGVIVLRQGSVFEMIRFSNMVIGSDDRATLTVDTLGRNLAPTPPYAGAATGESFQAGASAIITNDPWTTSQFAILGNSNVWTTEQIFSVSPSIPDGTTSNDPASYGQLLTALALIAAKANIASPTFTGAPLTPTPTVPTGIANKSFVEYLISQTALGTNLAFRNVTIVYNSDGNIITITDNTLLLVYAITWSDDNPITMTETLNGVLQYTYTFTWNVDGQLTNLVRT